VLTVGEVVAGYRIERVLGSGGMGSVYLAANPTLPRLDAVKVLSAELSRDPDFRARFVREADVAAALDHPQIVSVYNRGETDDGQLWIAMQFVDGTDADAALRAGTMTAPRAVHIISEVAKALDFAHAHNVVHRDVKPANFQLQPPQRAGSGEAIFEVNDDGTVGLYIFANAKGTGGRSWNWTGNHQDAPAAVAAANAAGVGAGEDVYAANDVGTVGLYLLR
jgi:serine/threonine protein kinase